MINMSFLITVKNEIDELQKLISFIKPYIMIDDQLIVLLDSNNDGLVEKYLNDNNININKYFLNEDFASFKNYGISLCKKQYIFHLDADEFPTEYIMENIKQIIETNNYPECIWFPRINIVNGITEEWTIKFRYSINQYGWINYPDYQQRVFLNNDNIKWKNKVHERLQDYKTELILPHDFNIAEYIAIKHIKSLDKQIKQNNYYSNIK